MMEVTPGSTNVTTYFVLRDITDGTELTAVTITDIDLTYTRSGEAPSAKADATALALTTTVHTDNAGIAIDDTDAPGLIRIDWPDAAWVAGVEEVILSVKLAGAFTEHLRVKLQGDLYGSGIALMTYTSKVGGVATDGVTVQCYDDLAMTIQRGGTQTSAGGGKTYWICTTGVTYYFVNQKSGVTWTIPDTEVA